MHIHQALADLHEIQATFLRTNRFRLLRATIVASTGLLGVSAALLQPVLLAQNVLTPLAYCVYWSFVASVAVSITLIGVTTRYWREPTRWERQLWAEAAWLFLPAIFIGGVVTLIAAKQENALIIYLPGLWMLFFGLGIWSAARLFSRWIVVIAAYYFFAGAITLLFSQAYPYCPAFMFCGFGIGQILMSGVLLYDEQKINAEQ